MKALLAGLVFAVSAAGAAAEGPTVRCSFDGCLKTQAGAAPVESKGITVVPGYEGKAAAIHRPAVLTYPTLGLNPEAFTISFRIRHEEPLEHYYFKRLVYFYHETSDMKNRIGILKREGTNQFFFFFSNAQGNAKGFNFADNWFAMATEPIAWEGGTWHHIVCTADKPRGIAQFSIDGKKAAEAHGSQFPEALGEVFWIGSEQGHSWMRGAIDELAIEPVSRLAEGPVVSLGPARNSPPPLGKALGESVGRITGEELSINLDFFDICIGTDCWDIPNSEAEMERLMAVCAHFGFDRVFFRVSVCGAVCYHTKVMTPAFENVFEKYTAEILDTGCANIPSRHRRMGEVMRVIDPLACCAKYARKYGMEIYAWVTIYDSLYYAPPTEFFQRHPEYTWVNKDGTRHIGGVPCYAYPEVRNYRLAQMKELVQYDIDGILLSDRSHSPWPGRGGGGGNEGARGYGFNEPVVEEYARRYGKDPRTAEADSLDEIRFVQLKGDFLTRFLREVKAVTSAADKKLAVTTDERIADPVRANWMYVDAETLAREQIVDELCIRSGAGANLDHWRVLADGRIKATTWAGIHGKTYAECLQRMRSEVQKMLENPTSDGSTFHELANLIYPDCWEEAVVDVVESWQAKPR